MEEQSVVDENVHAAREAHRAEVARRGQLIEDLLDPSKRDELAALPPHALG